MIRLMRALSLLAFALVQAAQTHAQTLSSVSVDLASVADSAGYMVYSYTVQNPASSGWSVSAVGLDVSASSGTPVSLPAIGEFLDMTVGSNAVQPLTPYAQIGPTSPTSWWAELRRTGELWWYAPGSGLVELDSIAPGASKPGFALRSTYLPDIRVAQAEPTWQSCCTIPDPETNENPSTSEFMVSDYSVVPGYAAEEVTAGVVQSQVGTICDEPLWLSDSALCAEFGNLADSAAAAFSTGNLQGAAMALSDLLDRVEAEQQQMHSNAYWLLSLNIHQAYANVAAAGPSTLGVICDPSTVERAAGPVSCAPSAPIPPMGSPFFELTGWRFVGGPGGEFDVTSAGVPPAAWEGLMVMSGSVWVYGTVAGVADSASTTVEVTPRSWPAIPSLPAFERDQDWGGSMPSVPVAQEDLAQLYHSWPTGGTAEEVAARRVSVENGPNASLAYYSESLLESYRPYYKINRDALTDDQNTWYQNHPVGGNGSICRRRDLPTIVLDFFEDRMVEEGGAGTDHWPQLAFHITHEALVSSSVEDLLSAFQAALLTDWAVLEAVRQQLPPAVPPCTLLY